MSRLWFRNTIVLSLITLAAVHPTNSFAQNSGFAIQSVVKRGDPVGDGGRFFDCNDCDGRVVGKRALNNRGDVAIAADVVSGTCFTNNFLISGGQSIRLGDFCHVTEFGKLTFLGSVAINDNGQAVENAGITVNNRIVQMLLLYSEGKLTRIAQEGDLTPAGTIIKDCGFGPPAMNNSGEVAFHACGETLDGHFKDGVFKHSGGSLHKVVVSGDPSPFASDFVINFFPAQPVQINESGDVLFFASVVPEPGDFHRSGLFLSTRDGFLRIALEKDLMPNGTTIARINGFLGALNNKGEVAFSALLSREESDSGIFLYSGGQIQKIMAHADPTPLGGTFAPLHDPEFKKDFVTPRINDNGAVAFLADVDNGSAPAALFLASPRAMVKIIGIGDRLPTGEVIGQINTYALNDLGQVAFFANGSSNILKPKPLGVYLATPVPPVISSVKLKHKKGSLQLRTNGSAMITNDTVIEVNGVPLDAINYPSDFREDGGFTTRVVSRDSRLEQLIQPGQTVQVTVFNSLTNLRSAPVSLTR